VCKSSLVVPNLSTIKTLAGPLRGTTHQLGTLRPQANQSGISEELGPQRWGVQARPAWWTRPGTYQPSPSYGWNRREDRSRQPRKAVCL